MPKTKELQELSLFFNEAAAFFGQVQKEIAAAMLISSAELREETSRKLQMPDHAIIREIDDALLQVIKVMPLASMYGCNLFTTLASMHSQMTEDQTIKTLITMNDEILFESMHN